MWDRVVEEENNGQKYSQVPSGNNCGKRFSNRMKHLFSLVLSMIFTYVKAAPTHKARLLGNVQGVVVQAR